jgi:sec-independent protein translocase protein TatC
MSTHPRHSDPDDMFADTRMSFGEHLEDLRIHLWRAIGGFILAVIFSFFIGNPILQFIAMPVETALTEFYDNRVREELEGLDKGTIQELPATPFVKITFVREQLWDALVENKDVSNFPRPQWKTDADGKPIVADPNGEGLHAVTVWVSYDEPTRVAAYMQEGQRRVGKRPALTTLSIQEGIVVYVKVCVVTGLVIGSPWIFYQIWAFVAAGLYPNEKRLVHYFLPLSLFLFLGGVAVCEFAVMPKAVSALLWFNKWLGLEPDLRLNEWLGFAIWMPVVFGLSFQTPLVMLFLERIGVLDVDSYRKYRRICWFAMAVFAAVITPSVDPVSMLLMWVPMLGLFELGIWLCMLQPKQRDLDIDVPESGEQIEV